MSMDIGLRAIVGQDPAPAAAAESRHGEATTLKIPLLDNAMIAAQSVGVVVMANGVVTAVTGRPNAARTFGAGAAIFVASFLPLAIRSWNR